MKQELQPWSRLTFAWTVWGMATLELIALWTISRSALLPGKEQIPVAVLFFGILLGITVGLPSVFRYRWTGKYDPEIRPVTWNTALLICSTLIVLGLCEFLDEKVQLWGLTGNAWVWILIGIGLGHFMWPPEPDDNLEEPKEEGLKCA